MTSKFRLVGVGVALVAMFAMFAMATSSAMAEDVCVPKAKGLWMIRSSAGECLEELAAEDGEFELIEFLLAEWLVNGAAVVATLLITSVSSALLLEDSKATLGVKAMVLCSGFLDGFIGPNGADEITELLTLAGVGVPLTVLTGTALLCSGQEGCETSTEGAEVWAANLPWLTLVELFEEESPTLVTGFVDLISKSAGGGEPGWYVQCKTLAGTVDDECTGVFGANEATNVAGGGVNGAFTEAFQLLMGGVNATCSASSSKETGIVEGVGESTSEEGELAVSSTG
jgi:hypothetical protein